MILKINGTSKYSLDTVKECLIENVSSIVIPKEKVTARCCTPMTASGTGSTKSSTTGLSRTDARRDRPRPARRAVGRRPAGRPCGARRQDGRSGRPSPDTSVRSR